MYVESLTSIFWQKDRIWRFRPPRATTNKWEDFHFPFKRQDNQQKRESLLLFWAVFLLTSWNQFQLHKPVNPSNACQTKFQKNAIYVSNLTLEKQQEFNLFCALESMFFSLSISGGFQEILPFKYLCWFCYRTELPRDLLFVNDVEQAKRRSRWSRLKTAERGEVWSGVME